MNNKKGEIESVDQVSINAAEKPTIQYRQGELDRMFDEAESALAATGRVYHRGGALVSLTDDGRTFALSPPSVLILLARAACWVRKTRNEEGDAVIKKVDPPMAVAAAMPKASEWKTLPELFHVVDHPLFLAETGELLARGYDSKSKFFGNFRPLQSVNIDANLDDAKKAEAYIQKLFETLDLETDADRAAALCAVLTAVSRPALRTAPMFLVTAPVIGSGKGMFARLVSNFASAGEPPAKTLQGDEDEIKKELISALLTGAPVLFFDEVRGSEIDSPSLRTLSTSETLSGRLLGTNKDVNLSTRTLVFVTGNNVSPSADTARRMLEIRLNPRCENPATRKFKVDPIKFARENRSTLIRAALTIQAAYSNYLKAGGAEPGYSGRS